MTDAPNRGDTEYIRADLYTAMQTRLAEVQAERDEWWFKAVEEKRLRLELEAKLAEVDAGRQSLFDLWSKEKAARFEAETRAEAAEARLAEVEAERDALLEIVAFRENNCLARAEAAEAALATARAQRLEALNCNAWQAQRIAQLEAIIKDTAK